MISVLEGFEPSIGDSKSPVLYHYTIGPQFIYGGFFKLIFAKLNNVFDNIDLCIIHQK